MSEQVETFADPTPKEVPHNTQVSVDLNSQGADVDSFENGTYVTELPENKEEGNQEAAGEAKEETKEASKEAKKADEKQTELLDDQEDDGEEAESKDDDGDAEEKKADSSSEDGEQDSEEKAEEKPKGKTVRVKDGDEAVDVSLDATLPVIVKGRKEFPTIAELRQNYSGKKAWGQEIEKVKEKEQVLVERETKFNADREKVINHFNHIGELIDNAFQKPDADPVAALKHLVEISGKDVLFLEKRLMEHYGHQIRDFDLMDEAEQEAYWLRRELEITKNTQATQKKLREREQSQEESLQKVRQIREQFGVSEKEFENATKAMADLGYEAENLPPEAVCKYVKLLPNVERVGDFCRENEFDKELSDDDFDALVANTSELLLDHDYLDVSEAIKLVGKKMGIEFEDEDSLVQDLKEKTKKPASRLASDNKAKKVAAREEDHVESFDDYDTLIYG